MLARGHGNRRGRSRFRGRGGGRLDSLGARVAAYGRGRAGKNGAAKRGFSGVGDVAGELRLSRQFPLLFAAFPVAVFCVCVIFFSYCLSEGRHAWNILFCGAPAYHPASRALLLVFDVNTFAHKAPA
ncbi:hypothetical protein TcCL_NonESM04449 [Trypanosoma cruzi]|nr:hypothetical protein TcCL_NonESM04449 [Trypanosoma cruzi]